MARTREAPQEQQAPAQTPPAVAPPPASGLFWVRISPYPRHLISAGSPASAGELYRRQLGIYRPDLVPEVTPFTES